jgi:hypothetical protein
VYLSYFATAEEAALCIARPPEGRAAAERAVPVVPQLSEEETEQGQGPAYATRRIRQGRGRAIRHCRQGGGRDPVRALCSLHMDLETACI